MNVITQLEFEHAYNDSTVPRFNHYTTRMMLRYLFKMKKKSKSNKTIRIYSQDIRMEFEIERCAMLIMKKCKREMTEGITLLNHKSTWRKGKSQVLRNFGYGNHQTEMKEKK